MATQAEADAEHRRGHTCPRCGGACWRESADVGVGVIYGPWGCPCGWSESEEYDQAAGPTSARGCRTDQWGWLYPAEPVETVSTERGSTDGLH